MAVLHNNDDAEDAVQDTVLKLWNMRDQLDIYRSIEALAIVIVRRTSLNSRRRMTVTLHERLAEEQPADSLTDAMLISRDEQEKLERILATLPDTQNAVLRMKHIDGIETEDIARITGCSTEAVRQNLSRARRKIMAHFINNR